MSGYGTYQYNVGPAQVEPVFGKPINPNPTIPYIAGGSGQATARIPHALPSEFDDVTRSFGFRVIEAMLTDPAVRSSYMSLKVSMISGALQVKPAVRPKGYRDGKDYKNVDDSKAKLSPQESRSIEIKEFIERDLYRPKKSIKSTMMQMLDKMAFGCRLTEKTREEVKAGPDKGKLGMCDRSVKPHWAWRFVVDHTMKPCYILTWLPPNIKAPKGSAGYALIPVDKFIISTWMPVDEDPRGSCILRAAYDWWNLKQQIRLPYYQHLRRFGSPSLNAMSSASDTASRYQLDPTTGLELPNLPMVDPVTRMVQSLIAFQNNSVIVRPPGSELEIMEPSSNGESFLNAFDMIDRAITLAIAGQTRATLEAKNGSKADSETAQDGRQMTTEFGKEELGWEFSRQEFYESVKLNFGEDDAEEFTPQLVVGKTEQQDKAAFITSISGAGFTIGQSQLTELDVEAGLPERDEEADAQHAADQMKQQADLAAQMKPAPGAPGGKPPGGQPAKPKPGQKPAPAKPPAKGAGK